jgi:hypothetical protein
MYVFTCNPKRSVEARDIEKGEEEDRQKQVRRTDPETRGQHRSNMTHQIYGIRTDVTGI